MVPNMHVNMTDYTTDMLQDTKPDSSHSSDSSCVVVLVASNIHSLNKTCKYSSLSQAGKTVKVKAVLLQYKQYILEFQLLVYSVCFNVVWTVVLCVLNCVMDSYIQTNVSHMAIFIICAWRQADCSYFLHSYLSSSHA